MKTISLTGTKRELGTKSDIRVLRSQGYIPCEMYGKSGNIHFTVFSSELNNLIYTPETYKVDLTIDGETYQVVKKEVQFHPLSDETLHVDFFEIDENKKIKLELPIRYIGTAAGAREGGKFVKKLRNIKVKGFPKDMPDAIEVDITELGLGKSIKVREIQPGALEILNAPSIPMATVEIPRSMRGKAAEETKAAPGKKKK